MSAEIHFEPEPGSTSAMPNITPPKPALRVAVAMVALTFTMAFLASQFGIFKSPDIYENPVAQRALSFADAADGGILVRDGATGETALTLPAGTNGFLRGALRAMADRRRVAQKSPDAPFLLTAWGDGRVTIEDPETRERIAVSSFGPTQVKSFVALLDKDGTMFAGPP
ncbi:photosynthetic complex assembly protein PuhC [Pseudogemmatithrix spongiicola]|uniref:Photosynthetic complex assembly protein PuhC n=1 Tax=Pseudogemmatithrix spongiicola TaxID=3062599 RepID=A0AA49Q6H6_9BACT|nr:photosynthetic complex assembly protein PuhC [Gemmatimonadaceae bacterium 'strain 318']